MEFLNVTSLPIIMAIVYTLIEIYKTVFTSEKAKSLVPIVGVILGAVLGVLTYYLAKEIMPAKDFLSALLVGITSGLSATGVNQIFKQKEKRLLIKNAQKASENEIATDEVATDKIATDEIANENAQQLTEQLEAKDETKFE